MAELEDIPRSNTIGKSLFKIIEMICPGLRVVITESL